MAAQTTRAPRHLSRSSKLLYRSICEEYELDGEPAALTTLSEGLTSLDRGIEARKTVETEGLTVVAGNGTIRAHPAVQIERDSRVAYLRAIRELALGVDYAEARPPRVGGGGLR
jgi:phage terminase small subunit